MKTRSLVQTAILSIALILLGILGNKFLAAQKKDVPKEKPRPITIMAKAQIVRYSALSPQVESNGRIHSIESMDLVPEVSAKALEIPFRLREGMHFAKGDTLLKLDDEQVRNSLQSAVSDLMSALASILPDIKTDWPQSAELWIKFMAELKFDALPALPDTQGNEKLFLARNKIFTLYYNARNLELQLHRHALIAPFYGTVASTMVSPGSFVRTGVSVAKITRTDALELDIPLSLDQASALRPGQRIEVFTPHSSEAILGTINRISTLLDDRTQSRMAYIGLRHAPNLGILPGAYASIRAKTQILPKAFAIPRAAVLSSGLVHQVKQGKLQPVAVIFGAQDLENAYITSGLQEGDTVLVQPVAEALPGMSIQVHIAKD